MPRLHTAEWKVDLQGRIEKEIDRSKHKLLLWIIPAASEKKN
jgi:hypothetical protein